MLSGLSPRQRLEVSAGAALELKRREEAREYLADLFAFNREVLGYADMAEQPHRLMCDSVCYSEKLRLLHEWPRSHFKSSMITVGDATRRICKDPNLRIFIGNVVLGNAKSFLREIKGHFERNERLKHYYGDHVSKDDKWSETQIISAQRTRNLKEPTVQVAGVGQSLASQHYDVMYLDDLVDQNTVTTAEQLAKTKEWYRLAVSLLEPGGLLVVIGTRYHDSDLYGYIEKELSEEFDIQVHSVYVDDDESKGPIFPSRFTPETIAGIRKEQGSYIFACQYRNSPIDDETAKFKRSQMRFVPKEALQGKQLYTTLTLDRAYSLNKTADYSGVTVRSVDMENIWYVRHAKRYKVREGKLLDILFDLKNYYRVDKVGIEQKAYEDTIKPVLDEEMRRRNDFFLVEELKGRTSKTARIEGLVPRFESESVFLVGEEEDFYDLVQELTRFPTADHDDVADSLAYHNDLPGMPSDDSEIPEYEPVFARSGY